MKSLRICHINPGRKSLTDSNFYNTWSIPLIQEVKYANIKLYTHAFSSLFNHKVNWNDLLIFTYWIIQENWDHSFGNVENYISFGSCLGIAISSSFVFINSCFSRVPQSNKHIASKIARGNEVKDNALGKMYRSVIIEWQGLMLEKNFSLYLYLSIYLSLYIYINYQGFIKPPTPPDPPNSEVPPNPEQDYPSRPSRNLDCCRLL